MEALVAVTAAALTVYDMCKALDKGMEITDIYLVEKTGGKSGDFVVKASKKARHGPQTMTGAAGKTTVKLLLVEDNPLVLELVFRGIEHVCDVMVAHDGGDALLKTVDDPPDVILCDYKMPGSTVVSS